MRHILIAGSAILAVAAGTACAQQDAAEEQPAGADAEEMIPEPDIVYGRQVLMAGMDNLMLPIDRARNGEPFDLADARVRAEAISVMLTAFPFMFPEGTGPEETRDNDWPSIALPTVWEANAEFHETAEEVAEHAFEMVAISDEEEFRAAAAVLRQECDSCHASYMYDWRLEGELDPVTGEPLPRQ